MKEKLKEILGVNYTEDIGQKIQDEIGKAFVSKADFNAKNEAKKALEAQIAERDKQLEELKKVDASKLQAEIARLQGENTASKSDFEKQINTLKLTNALDIALLGAKARDVKAVKPFLNLELIKLDGDKLLGFNEQLENIKKEKSFLFEDVSTPRATGAKVGGEVSTNNIKDQANNALRSLLGKEQ